MDTYAGYALHAQEPVGIRPGHGYDLAIRRLEPRPRLDANIEVDLILWMLEDLVVLDGLVLDRCGAVDADALDSDYCIFDGCVRLGAADHAVVVGDEVERVPSVGRLLERGFSHCSHRIPIILLISI